MALSSDLIATARQLAQLHQRRPRQADLRRAISTAYYALFHSLAETAADLLIFSTTFPDLQDLRHQADYDPVVRFQHSFVVAQVDEAKEALAALQRVGKPEQLDFISVDDFTQSVAYREIFGQGPDIDQGYVLLVRNRAGHYMIGSTG